MLHKAVLGKGIAGADVIDISHFFALILKISTRWSGDVIARDWGENFIAVSHKAARA